MLSRCFSQRNWITCSFWASGIRVFRFIIWATVVLQFPPALFLSSFFRSCVFQYLELVLHFPPVYFGSLFYLFLLILVLHFQSTRLSTYESIDTVRWPPSRWPVSGVFKFHIVRKCILSLLVRVKKYCENCIRCDGLRTVNRLPCSMRLTAKRLWDRPTDRVDCAPHATGATRQGRPSQRRVTARLMKYVTTT